MICVLDFQIKSLVISLSKKRTKLKSDCWTELLAYLFLLLQFFSKKARNEHAFLLDCLTTHEVQKNMLQKERATSKRKGLQQPYFFLLKLTQLVCTAIWWEKINWEHLEKQSVSVLHTMGGFINFCPKIISLFFQSCLFNTNMI